MPSASRVCPHCGRQQGLQATSGAPPAPSTGQTRSTSPAPPPQGACPHCRVSITPGDYFCRACGRALAAGVADPAAEAAGRAYGIAGLLSALLCFPPGAVILGIIAVAKGARGVGLASILAGLAMMGAVALLWVSIVSRMLSFFPDMAPLGEFAP